MQQGVGKQVQQDDSSDVYCTCIYIYTVRVYIYSGVRGLLIGKPTDRGAASQKSSPSPPSPLEALPEADDLRHVFFLSLREVTSCAVPLSCRHVLYYQYAPLPEADNSTIASNGCYYSR